MKHKAWGEMVQSVGADDNDTEREQSDTDKYREEADHTEHLRRLAISHRQHKDNVTHTRFLLAAAFACGVVVSQRGPSILDLGDITHASLQSSASLFALGALGQTMGAVGAGLLLGRLHSSAFLFWALLGMCASTAALPWCQHYGVMAALYCLSLLCVGGVETGSYSELAKRWGRQGNTKVQLLQLVFVVGGVVSPAMTQFFLKPGTRHHHTSINNVTSDQNGSTASTPSWTTDVTTTLETVSSWNQSQTVSGSKEATSQVEMAYAISGTLAFIAAMPFVLSFAVRKQLPKWAPQKPDLPPPNRSPAHDVCLPVLLLIAVFIFLISAVEESVPQFLFTFMVEEVGWSMRAASLVTSWFWAGVLLVRVAAFFLPGQLADEVILLLSCALLPCTLAALHGSVAVFSSNGVWASVFFAGMAVSLISPVSFTWIHTSLAQRSSLVSVVVMSASLAAGIVNPLVLGCFLHNGLYRGFTFLLLGEAALALVVFIVLYVLSRKLTAEWLTMASRKSFLVPGKLEEVRAEEDAQELQPR